MRAKKSAGVFWDWRGVELRIDQRFRRPKLALFSEIGTKSDWSPISLETSLSLRDRLIVLSAGE
jgi:hypothetical protein